MRLKRISLVVVLLLTLGGCSASRRTKQADSGYEGASPVPLPIRHADEYDSHGDDFDYWPDQDDSHPTPPPVPMREPVPAPPAIGVSRVKSVGWLRTVLDKSDLSECGDEQCGDPCRIGDQSKLPPEYFSKGCTAQPQTGCAQGIRILEKPSAFQTMRSWGQGWKKRFNRSGSSRQPGERVLVDPLCASESGCTSANDCASEGGCGSDITRRVPRTGHFNPAPLPRKPHHGSRGGSLAEPIDEFGWENPANTAEEDFSPDAAIEVPSRPPTAVPEISPKTRVPKVPALDAAPLLPQNQPQAAMPYNNFPPEHVTTPQSKSGGNFVRPPVWPKLTGLAAKSITHPQDMPAVEADNSLPLILPGRGI